MTEEKRDKMSIAKGSPIRQYSLEGKYIQTHQSIRIAATSIKCKKYEITGCLNNNRCLTGAGYIWIYEEDYLNCNIDKLLKSVEKYLQTGRRKSNISLNEKILIIQEYEKYSNEPIRKVAKKIATDKSMDYSIIEYYIRNKEVFLNKKKSYDIKLKNFIDNLYVSVESNPVLYPEINKRRELLQKKYL